MHSKTHMTKPNLCPTCGYTLDAVSELGSGGRQPQPGDASMCISCGELLEFNDDMGLNIMSEDTKLHIDPDDMVQLTFAQDCVRNSPKNKKLATLYH